jgi:hypothetical protein
MRRVFGSREKGREKVRRIGMQGGMAKDHPSDDQNRENVRTKPFRGTIGAPRNGMPSPTMKLISLIANSGV